MISRAALYAVSDKPKKLMEKLPRKHIVKITEHSFFIFVDGTVFEVVKHTIIHLI